VFAEFNKNVCVKDLEHILILQLDFWIKVQKILLTSKVVKSDPQIIIFIGDVKVESHSYNIMK